MSAEIKRSVFNGLKLTVPFPLSFICAVEAQHYAIRWWGANGLPQFLTAWFVLIGTLITTWSILAALEDLDNNTTKQVKRK